MKAVDWDVKPQTKNTNKHCGHKYFKLLTFLENIVDPDQLASNEAI